MNVGQSFRLSADRSTQTGFFENKVCCAPSATRDQCPTLWMKATVIKVAAEPGSWWASRNAVKLIYHFCVSPYDSLLAWLLTNLWLLSRTPTKLILFVLLILEHGSWRDVPLEPPTLLYLLLLQPQVAFWGIYLMGEVKSTWELLDVDSYLVRVYLLSSFQGKWNGIHIFIF